MNFWYLNEINLAEHNHAFCYKVKDAGVWDGQDIDGQYMDGQYRPWQE